MNFIIQKIGYAGLCVLALCLCCCNGREAGTFTITGEVKGLPEGKVKVYTYPPSSLLLDSCEIKDGKYFLKGKLESSQVGMLYFEVKPEYQENFMSMIRLFLEPSDIKVFSDLKDMKGTTKLENCPLNDQLIAHEKYLRTLPEHKKAAKLTNEIQSAFLEADMVCVRTLSKERDSLYAVLIDRLFTWQQGAGRSEVVAYLAGQYSSPFSGNEIQKIVERFAPDFRSFCYVAQMAQSAAKERNLEIGGLFPDFRAFDREGRNYSLADFQGKYLFVQFSASWCGWCKKEVPHIRKAYEQLKDRNIVFITMMMDTNRDQWLADADKEGISWLCLTDLQGIKKSPMAEAYNLKGIPDSFVVGPQGYILKRDLRGNEVSDYLSSLIPPSR